MKAASTLITSPFQSSYLTPDSSSQSLVLPSFSYNITLYNRSRGSTMASDTPTLTSPREGPSSITMLPPVPRYSLSYCRHTLSLWSSLASSHFKHGSRRIRLLHSAIFSWLSTRSLRPCMSLSSTFGGRYRPSVLPTTLAPSLSLKVPR